MTTKRQEAFVALGQLISTQIERDEAEAKFRKAKEAMEKILDKAFPLIQED